jgi:O-6-methylguanine DNA methyltransferase
MKKTPTEKRKLFFTVLKTRLCPIGVAASDRGIVYIELNCPDAKKFGRLLSERFDEEVVFKPTIPILKRAARQLTEYSMGKRRSFDLPLDLRSKGFTRRVQVGVARIPYGKTAAYGEVARRVGSPRAARAVGGAVGANPTPIIIPCHRVVAAGGKLGGFGGGLPLKRKLLNLEKIVI